MRPLLALLTLTGFALGANAQVLRCVDPAGNVSYTDQRCPAQTRQADQVLGPEATAPQPVREAPPAPLAPAANETARTPPPAASPPGGLIVIDPRGAERAEAQQRELERQRRDAEYAADGIGYPYPGFGRPPPRQRDMRPPLRSCDGSGCQDVLGNRYDNTGRLNSYRGIDGRTCRPVGTTTVCR